MSKSPDRVTGALERDRRRRQLSRGGLPTRADQTLTVLFDPATGLPARVRALDYDNIWGDVTWDMVLADWQTVGTTRIATSRKYELNGRTVMDVKLSEITAEHARSRRTASRSPAPSWPPRASRRSAGVPYQWILRRQFIGTYLDSEQPSYDTQSSPGLQLEELAPGIQHVVGGSHNSLIVEMKDHVIVFDAPVSDWQSTWTISAARGKYVRKPVKYLVLTHHHMDHAGGLRAYADAGATIVAGQGTAEHYKRVLAAPFTRNPVLSASDLTRTPIVEVTGKHVLSDGTRQVELYVLDPNPHADGLLIGYVPDAQARLRDRHLEPRRRAAAGQAEPGPGRAGGGREEGGHRPREVRGRARHHRGLRAAGRAGGQVARDAPEPHALQVAPWSRRRPPRRRRRPRSNRNTWRYAMPGAVGRTRKMSGAIGSMANAQRAVRAGSVLDDQRAIPDADDVPAGDLGALVAAGEGARAHRRRSVARRTSAARCAGRRDPCGT